MVMLFVVKGCLHTDLPACPSGVPLVPLSTLPGHHGMPVFFLTPPGRFYVGAVALTVL